MVTAANTRQELYRGILALHTALRKCAIRCEDHGIVRSCYCMLCKRAWLDTEEEKHGTDCLASPAADLIKSADDEAG